MLVRLRENKGDKERNEARKRIGTSPSRICAASIITTLKTTDTFQVQFSAFQQISPCKHTPCYMNFEAILANACFITAEQKNLLNQMDNLQAQFYISSYFTLHLLSFLLAINDATVLLLQQFMIYVLRASVDGYFRYLFRFLLRTSVLPFALHFHCNP